MDFYDRSLRWCDERLTSSVIFFHCEGFFVSSAQKADKQQQNDTSSTCRLGCHFKYRYRRFPSKLAAGLDFSNQTLCLNRILCRMNLCNKSERADHVFLFSHLFCNLVFEQNLAAEGQTRVSLTLQRQTWFCVGIQIFLNLT